MKPSRWRTLFPWLQSQAPEAAPSPFCVLPWLHLHVAPNEEILPCCYGDSNAPAFGQYRGQSVNEMLNSEVFKEFRKDLMNGKSRPDVCSRCYREEEASGGSHRTRQNANFLKWMPPLQDITESDGTLKDVRLSSWDVRFSNVCNLRCRSCGPIYSSSWAAELKQDTSIAIDSKTKFETLRPQLAHVKEIYFAGGEPLLMEENYLILEDLHRMGRHEVHLVYNTNASVWSFKGRSVLDLWKNFANVRVCPSIDETGARAEYVRKGTKWNQLVQGILELRRQCPRAEVKPTMSFSIFNVMRLPQILEELRGSGILDLQAQMILNPVDEPRMFSYDVIPLEDRLEVLKEIDLLEKKWGVKVPAFEGLRGLLRKPTSPLHKEFLEETRRVDQRRGENFEQTFPEIFQLLSRL